MIRKILFTIFIFLSFFTLAKADLIDDIFDEKTSPVIYCKWDDCSLEKWTQAVKNGIENIEKNKTASQYIMSVVRYLATFVSLVWVLYVMYAWFIVLTWWWNEEKQKKSKTIIMWVLIWIVLMWLAYSIVTFIINVVTTPQ